MADDAPLEQLPRGRHRLTREQVMDSQRGRILAAMADTVAEKTFAATTVGDVVKRARVSRETFYEHYAGKEECFLAALEAGEEVVRDAMTAEFARSAPAPGGSRSDALRHVLEVYLETLASEPAVARTFLVEVYGAGEEARRRRVEVHKRFAQTVAALLGARTEQERFACEALVAAVGQLVTLRLCVDEGASLPELAEPIAGLVDDYLSRRRPD